MTLQELADLACAKVHRQDNVSLIEAKKYCRARYQMFWDSRVWRDSQGVLAVNFAATQQQILPVIVDKVLGCRWSKNLRLPFEQPITVLSLEPSLFNDAGDPLAYYLMSSSGVSAAPNGERIEIRSTFPGAAYNVSIHGALAGMEQSEVMTASGISWTQSVNTYDEIFTLSKNDTVSDLQARNYVSQTSLLTLTPAETHRRHQRINFITVPQTISSTGLVLFKRRCRPLINDSDATEISGIDNALLSYVIADMLESQRQYTKSQAKAQEAGILTTSVIDGEMHQSENMVRIVPEDDGYSTTEDVSGFLGTHA